MPVNGDSKKSVFNLIVEVLAGIKSGFSREWREEFFNEQARINFHRNRIFTVILFLLNIGFLYTDWVNRERGWWITTPGYRLLFYAHLVLAAGLLVFLFVSSARKLKDSIGDTVWTKVYNFSFILFTLLLCAAISGIDQLIHGQITVYIFGACAAAVVNYYTPLTSLILYLLSLILFSMGIAHFQHDENILRGHYINGPLLVVISWLMSLILFKMRAGEFISKKTIEIKKSELERANSELTAANRNLRETLLYLDESQNMIFTLALALESKDPYTRGHSERVAKYAVQLARHLGLPESFHTQLWQAAILHDIGKIGIPDAILNKKTDLDPEEWSIMKSHPVRGEIICSKLNFARDILPAIRYHHERFDGKGYPDGLKGEAIPYLARIISIADAVDAMVSDRSYRSAINIEMALETLKKLAGARFDPLLVDAFIKSHANAFIDKSA